MTEISIAICVFAYKRPEHLRLTLTALETNIGIDSVPVKIYIDGPKDQFDTEKQTQVLAVAHEHRRFKDLSIIHRTKNLGLYRSLTAGITETLLLYDAVIVIEDDIVTSPHFVSFMLDGLRIYSDDKRVASIHGYTPPIRQTLPETFFLRGADCWGWGTWRDRWSTFRADAFQMSTEIRRRRLTSEFNLLGGYDYLKMLNDRAEDKNNSWAICWHASCFLANMLTLYPGKSLVTNIGLDGSGEHCCPNDNLHTTINDSPISIQQMNPAVDPQVFQHYCNHFNTKPTLLKRIKRRLAVLGIGNKVSYPAHVVTRLNLKGPYSNYELALADSNGYDTAIILDKVKQATIDLLNKKGVYERDGTLFSEFPPVLEVRELLEKLVNTNDIILDFGGGLGGTYINNMDILKHRSTYIVIEQPSFARQGEELASLYNLDIKFCSNIEMITVKPDLVILSSVLQYIPSPLKILEDVLRLSPKAIIIDRTSFTEHKTLKWWVQVEEKYYVSPISYPVCPQIYEEIVGKLPGYYVDKTWINSFDPHVPLHQGILLIRS